MDASFPNMPSTETTKDDKCWFCSRHELRWQIMISPYKLHSFSLSFFWRTRTSAAAFCVQSATLAIFPFLPSRHG
eukprot:4972677-Ditylum_brightwellii.AAC.1